MTSTEPFGQRDLLDVAPDELDVLHPRLRRVRTREREHLVGHVQANRLPARTDAPGRDEHVRARARPEVKDRLTLAQVRDRRRDAAAERGVDRSGGRVGALLAVEHGAETLLAGVGGVEFRVRPVLGVGGLARGGRVPSADRLAKVLRLSPSGAAAAGGGSAAAAAAVLLGGLAA